MISLYNIIQSSRVRENPEDEVLIDSNRLFEKTYEKLEKEAEEEKHEEPKMEARPVLDENGNPKVDENGEPVTEMVEVSESPAPTVSGEEILSQAREEAEKVLSDAKEQAGQILSDAGAKAEALKEHAREEGRKDGYQEGSIQAEKELSQKRDELSQREESLKAEYEEKESRLEQDLVDTILSVVDKVFLSEVSGKKDIIIHLVDQALMNAETSKEFQIHVSPENAAKLKDKEADWRERLGSDVQLDVIPDPLLDETQCTIETDGGMFDCSLDTELDNLFRDIRALSS